MDIYCVIKCQLNYFIRKPVFGLILNKLITHESSLISTAAVNWQVATDKGYIRWLSRRPILTHDEAPDSCDKPFPEWSKNIEKYALVVLEVNELDRISGYTEEMKGQFGAYLSAEELLFKTKIDYMRVVDMDTSIEDSNDDASDSPDENDPDENDPDENCSDESSTAVER